MIDKPGIYKNMAMDRYIGDPCLVPSLSSGLASLLLIACPLKVFMSHPRLCPDYEEDNGKQMDLGSACHSMLLEGEDVVQIIDADSYRTKAAQQARDDARTLGKVPLLPAQYDTVKAMVVSAQQQLRASELAIKDLRSEGESELTFIWQESENVWCRIRPDWLSNDQAVTISYKTTSTTANPFASGRLVENMGWDIAAAFYLRGMKKVAGITPAYIYMVQETEKPYLCSFMGLTPQYLDMGRQKVKMALELWKKYLTEGHWPGYPSRVAYVEPAAWMLAQWEERRFSLELQMTGDRTEDWGE